MSNPLLEKFETPFETIPFDRIRPEHFLPAISEAMNAAKKEIDLIKKNTERETFGNTVVALEKAQYQVNHLARIFFNLHSAESNKELQGIAKEVSPMLTDFGNDLTLDRELFERVQKVYDKIDQLNLETEERTLLENTYKDFVRNGALLNEEQKEKLRELDKRKSQLALEFGDHVLEETNSFELYVDSQDQIKGLPEGAMEAAASAAKEKGHDGKWLFTLHIPSFLPFMTYVENRELREKMYRAFASRAFGKNDNDNSDIVIEIAKIRHERANLLGFKTHADFVLEQRMAETPKRVHEFLEELLDYSKPAALKEMQELQEYAKANGGPEELQAWDYNFWANKLKKEKHELDEEELKPYFKLENVVDGAFEVAKRLFSIDFKERRDIPVYHQDVKTFEVINHKGQHVGVFYADFFPREGKRSGAWMTSFRSQRMDGNTDIRPHVSNVCNFTKPTESKPSLLTFDEVTTLFHEFGHALHELLSKCKYESLSGASVYWDFVELPSQIMENWCYEKECLDIFAKHYETGEKIPSELVARLKSASNFHSGRHSMRQLSFALLDMAWHGQDPSSINDVDKFEQKVMGRTNILPHVEGTNMSCSFGHIFQGGYSAGYYSYKWAEVLDADAFEFFKEKGIFDKETAESFVENILSRGGSEHPMELYKRFRGQEPSPKALLKRDGLLN